MRGQGSCPTNPPIETIKCDASLSPGIPQIRSTRNTRMAFTRDEEPSLQTEGEMLPPPPRHRKPTLGDWLKASMKWVQKVEHSIDEQIRRQLQFINKASASPFKWVKVQGDDINTTSSYGCDSNMMVKLTESAIRNWSPLAEALPLNQFVTRTEEVSTFPQLSFAEMRDKSGDDFDSNDESSPTLITDDDEFSCDN